MPSGERLPGVLWPWAGSRRMSISLRRQPGDSGGEGRENFAIFEVITGNKTAYYDRDSDKHI